MTKPPTPTGQAENWSEIQHETWNRRAKDYEKLDWVIKSDFMASMIDFCEAQPTWSALDIGTGPGLVADVLRPRVGHVTGVDISEAMIEKATQANGAANVTFRVGNVEELDLPDNTFDLVTARMVFHHVENVPRGLSEIYRVLKPGGRLVLCEGVPPDHLTRQRYEEIFALKEERHTFSEAELINYFDHADFENLLVKPYFMRQVSLNNWLENGALTKEAIAEIYRLHVEADPHFKEIYRLRETEDDVFMDWKFIIIRGLKRQAA